MLTGGVIIEFTKIKNVFEEGIPGRKYKIRGWIYRRREFKDKIFILIRDSSGIIQGILPKTSIDNSTLKNISIEASIELVGTLREDKRAPGGYEIDIENIKVIGPSNNFPITKDFSREFLLNVRHLWVRSRKMTSILKIRSTIFEAIHEFFRLNDFYEVQAPMFINVAVEGGATLFSLKYFEKGDVYLTQSSQFYLEALIFSLEKVYTIAPSFRAEKSRTRRHLTEFWHAEAEMAWYSMNDIIDFEEKLITYIVRKVLEKNIDELKLLNRDLEKLECIKPPFYRITYDDALRRLEEKEIYVEWGDDLGADEEYALTIDFNKPIFIYGYPEKIKAFYHKNDPNRPEVTLSVDLLAPEGYGEIIGGGERIENEKDLIEKIKRFGLNPKDYEWYIDLRRYGSVPHSGFGLGVDRLVWWICGLEYITDAIPFPRTIRRIYP